MAEDITWHDPPAGENVDWHDRPRVIINTNEAPDHGLSERQKLSPVEKALSPITGYWDTQKKMSREALDLVSSGVDQVSKGFDAAKPYSLAGLGDALMGAGKTIAGAAGYVASPATSAIRSVVGQPIEDVTGIPREYPEFITQLLTPGLGMARYGAVPKELPPGFAPTRAPPGSGPDVVAAADRLSQTGTPVEIPRAAASDRVPVQQAGAVVANIPFGGTPLVKAAGQSLEQLGGKASEVAASYGAAAAPAKTGEIASNSITDWITGESKANVDKAYAKVDAAVDPNITTPLEKTLDTVSQIAAKQTASGLAPGKAVDMVLPALQRPGGLTYEGIKNLRTNIGGMLSRGILPDGVDGGQLKQIYGALSEDLKTSVAASGPKASAAFDRANRYTDLVTSRREALTKIVGTEGDAAPEKVFDRLTAMAGSASRADINKLAQARKAMGSDDWNELASSVISRLGRDVEGNFSPERFITDYNKISDAGKNLLFKSTDNPLKTHLDDIATVSSRFKQLQKFANPSGSGRQIAGAALFFEPLTTLKAILGGRVVASILAKPAQAASVAKWSRAKYSLAASPGPATLAAYALATRNLISTTGTKDVTADDFMRQLQQ
jgi:hypothetical protein